MNGPNSFVPVRPQDARSALRLLVDALIPVPGSSCNGAQQWGITDEEEPA